MEIAKETQKLNWYDIIVVTFIKSFDGSLRFAPHRAQLVRVHDRYLQLTNRKLNTSPATLDEKDALKKFLTTPPVKKIDLHFPLGLEVTARNLKGVTIKDALDAIYKQFKKKVS